MLDSRSPGSEIFFLPVAGSGYHFTFSSFSFLFALISSIHDF